jgi:hypothetical protein
MEAEAAAGPACGAAPDRYTVLSGSMAGLVRDNQTGLIWMATSVGGDEAGDGGQQTQCLAEAYCKGKGMRLPTDLEALAISGSGYASCAFNQWSTWTSTYTTDAGASGVCGDAGGTTNAVSAYTVDYLGDNFPQLADNYPNAVLCVMSPSG